MNAATLDLTKDGRSTLLKGYNEVEAHSWTIGGVLKRHRVLRCVIDSDQYKQIQKARELVDRFDLEILNAKLKTVGSSGGGQRVDVSRQGFEIVIDFVYPPETGGFD